MNYWTRAELVGKPRGWIDEQVHFAIRDLRDGGRSEHRAHADAHEREVKRHRPATPSHPQEVASGPCAECGDTWPCQAIASVFSPG